MQAVALETNEVVSPPSMQDELPALESQVKPFPIQVSFPTQDDLPCYDGMPMETQRHKLQMDLLIDVLHTWLAKRSDGYVNGNMFIYFSAKQVRHQDFKGPDVFVALDSSKCERKSWVVWEEDGKTPDVVIELLSDSTRNTDKNEKKQIYQNKLRVPEYFWYDPFNSKDWAGFALHNGVYEPLTLDDQNRFISKRLGLAFVLWEGLYMDVKAHWLRCATLEGSLLPTALEMAEQKTARLAKKLRAMGIDPENC